MRILALSALALGLFLGTPAGAMEAPKTPAPAAAPAPEAKAAPSDYQLYLQSGDHDAKWDDAVRMAFETFDAGNLATAGIFLKQAYDRGCRDPLLLYRYGLAREGRGAYKEAAEMLFLAAQGIEQRYPGHPLERQVARDAGRALYEADDFRRAGPLLQKALAEAPGDFMLLLMGGQIARLEKRFADARMLFERALAAPAPAVAPRQPDPRAVVLRELVILTYDQKDLAACQAYLDQLAVIAPQDRLAAAYRARLAQERQQQKEDEIIKKIVK